MRIASIPYPLVWILLVALVARLAAATVLQHVLDRNHQQFLIAGDANGYWELAQRIASGEDYRFGDQPPRYALRMPGFPALLALVIRVAGESLYAARLVLAVVGTAACGAVFLLGRAVIDRRTGLLAAAICAVHPVLIGFSVEVLSETFFALMTILSLWTLSRLISRMDGFQVGDAAPDFDVTAGSARISIRQVRWEKFAKDAVFAGLMLAAACYVRPSWLLFAPLAAVWMWLFPQAAEKNSEICSVAVRDRQLLRRVRLLQGLLLLITVFVALLPWAWRNSRVTGHWVFTTLWVGPSLYDGLNPQATGDSDMRFFEENAPLHATLTEWQVDRYYRQLSWEFVLENPVRTLELALLKLGRYFSPWPNAAQFDSLGARLLVTLTFLPLALFSLIGLVQSRRNVWLIFLTFVPLVYFASIHAVFVGSLRYRLPVEYPLWILASRGLLLVSDRYFTRRAAHRSNPLPSTSSQELPRREGDA